MPTCARSWSESYRACVNLSREELKLTILSWTEKRYDMKPERAKISQTVT